MTERPIARGNVTRLESVTAFNLPVFEAHAELVSLLRRRLRESAAALFARPERSGNEIAWFSDVPGEVRRWVDLGPAERSRLEPLLAELDGEVSGLVARLGRAGPNTRDGNLSHVLEAALVVPGPEHIYLVGGSPVLAFWGFRGAGQSGVHPFRSTLQKPRAPSIPVLRRRPLWPWLLALGALLLVAVLLWRFWFGAALVKQLPPPTAKPEIPPIAQPETSGPPTVPLLTTPPQPEPPPRQIDVPPPQPEPPPQLEAPPQEQPPQPEAPPPPEPLPPHVDLPEQRWNAHDLSMLKGCWLLGREVPVYIGTEQGIMRAAHLCFDDSGHGRISQVSIFPSQTLNCTDTITGTFDKLNHLVARKPRTICGNGRAWAAGTFTCTRKDDSTATCTTGGEVGRADLEFRRAP